MSTVYPLHCKALLKEKIWGGRKFETLFGIELPSQVKVGEAWLAADLPEGASSILNGPRRGQDLSQAAKEWGEDLIGPAWRGKPTGGRFPLLIKLLDANDDLSVQVHPDEDACRSDFPNDFSKDESWIVLQADPGGSILHGFKPEVTLSEFEAELEAGRAVETMRRVEVQPGDSFRVAPRTVHALCSGVVILEIQEPSDTTFRIYDYGRLDDQGQPRDLHLDAARKVMAFGDDSPPKLEPRSIQVPWGELELLVDVPAYRIERFSLEESHTWKVDPRSVQVLIGLSGTIHLEAGGESISVKPGQCVILPATIGQVSIAPDTPGAKAVMAGAGHVPMLG